MYLDFCEKFASWSTFQAACSASAAVGAKSALSNIDHSRGMLVDKIYELDEGWYTSKPSDRLAKEICEFWLILEATRPTLWCTSQVFESEYLAKMGQEVEWAYPTNN